MQTFTKDPDETLDYAVDWSDWLASGETVASVVWVVPSGLTEVSSSNSTTRAIVWLSGGSETYRAPYTWPYRPLGTTATYPGAYVVVNRITSSAGRIAERSFALAVVRSIARTDQTFVPVSSPQGGALTIAEVKRHLNLDATAGEPAPTAPTVALVVAAGLVTTGVHRYLVTFVTADGETDAGAVSAAVTTDTATSGQVNLTAIPLGGQAVTARKVYRTQAGGSTYLLLTTLANNTATTYTDNLADASLGAQAPTTNTTVDPQLADFITQARQYCELRTGRLFPTSVPEPIKGAMKLLIGHWWEHREAVDIGNVTAVELPLGVAALLAAFEPVGIV